MNTIGVDAYHRQAGHSSFLRRRLWSRRASPRTVEGAIHHRTGARRRAVAAAERRCRCRNRDCETIPWPHGSCGAACSGSRREAERRPAAPAEPAADRCRGQEVTSPSLLPVRVGGALHRRKQIALSYLGTDYYVTLGFMSHE